jgi:hypothetical protein
MSAQQEYHEVYIKNEDFEKLRTDPKFITLLNLSRIVNALQFCFQTLLDYKDNETPVGSRQRLNSFLFTTGVLYEGLKVANTLGKHFRDRDSFRDGFGKLLNDKETKKLQGSVLETMRNRIAFHFDEDVAAEALKNLDFPSYLFATSLGSNRGSIYYNLADEAAINFLLGEPTSQEEERQLLEEMFKSIIYVLRLFVDAAEMLTGDILGDMNWMVRKGKIE